ncbi:sugar nucleotide-binding protein [Candidatus Pacearchaeota archaeon]|nr:sugar nucleotide-binding protein [Candidatus Pacearchaeota archaeon]
MTCMESYLIIGSDSMVGNALIEYLSRAGEKVIGTTRRHEAVNATNLYLDLADDVEMFQCPDGVTVAIVCAAVTKIEYCRLNPVETAQINVQSTVALVKKLVENGVFVIYLSTNQVFDGSTPHRNPDDSLSPITEYGRQKAEVERQFHKFNKSVAIVRFSKIMPSISPLFSAWIEGLKNGQTIHPFSDMYMAPVPLTYVTSVLRFVGDLRLSGIWQVSGNQDISYADVARFIARIIGKSESLVQPILVSQSIHMESVPSHTTLNIERVRENFGIEPPDVWWIVKNTLFSSIK